MYAVLNQVIFVLCFLKSVDVYGSSDSVQPSHNCVYESPEVCNNITGPYCSQSNRTVFCCNLNDDNIAENLFNITTQLTALHIQNSNFDVFNINITQWVKLLESLAVTNGRMNEFVPEWTRMNKIECLNLTSNGLRKVGKLGRASKLRMLDLSHNNLVEMPEVRKSSNDICTIDISDNSHLPCSLLLNFTRLINNIDFINMNNTWCMLGSYTKGSWVNSTGRLNFADIAKVEYINGKFNCTTIDGCTCEFQRVDNSNLMEAKLETAVDCSNGSLLQLPMPLPDNCVALNVSYNKITSLENINDPSYSHLRELYADHNNIMSLEKLEGSSFIDKFVRLDLRYNNITTITIHTFKRALTNGIRRELNLGHNHIECDCRAAKQLKPWLPSSTIQDHEEIFCLGTKNQKVSELIASELCRPKQTIADYVPYVIAVEVLLLASLIAKVLYDYWIFKSTGYLPWPASRMPKLPCDCLCE